MFKTLFSIFTLLIVCSSFYIPEPVLKKADKTIKKYFEVENFSRDVVSIPGELNKRTTSEFDEGNLFKINSNGRFLGYGYIGNAPSKAATFDYLVLFDTDFIIIKSKVLIYREEYGGEITSKRWLTQFNGATTASPELKYNQDIIPISGATISVRAMTKAINDLLQSLTFLQQQKIW